MPPAAADRKGSQRDAPVTQRDVAQLRHSLESLKNQLTEIQSQWTDSLDTLKSDVESATQTLTGQGDLLEGQKKTIDQIGGVVDNHAERLEIFRRAQMYIDGTMEKGQDELKNRLEKCDLEVQALGPKIETSLSNVRTELEQAISDVNTEVIRRADQASSAVSLAQECQQQLQDAKQELEEKFAKQLHALESRVLANFDEQLRHQVDRLEEKMVDEAERAQLSLDELAATLRREVQEADVKVQEEAALALGQAERKASEALAAKGEGWDASLKGLGAQLGDLRAETGRLDSVQRQLVADAAKDRSEAEHQLAAAVAASGRRVGNIEEDVGRLRRTVNEVGGIPTREVEWLLDDACVKKFRALQAEATADAPKSLFCQSFDAAGATGLQLELRTLGSADDADDALGARGHAGDCSFFLWSPPGVQLVYRLYIGQEALVLRHNFEKTGLCYGVRRMCFLSDHIDEHTGALRVGVEIHEASLESVSEVATAPEAMDVVGSIACRRYLNNKLMEMIQNQGKGLSEHVMKKVDLIRSKAVRRVQWRLEQAFMLREAFQMGKPVCSTAFQAAGINGLQLIFYPSGCKGAKDGFCSFFLSCPAGSSVRCWLWAGKWRKEARPELVGKGELLGRVNFCRFENCIDTVDESVELALEIEEAQLRDPAATSSSGNVSQVTLLQQEATPAPPSSAGQEAMQRSDTAVTKVKAGKAPSELTMKQLPSIWTSQGFQSFGDIGGSNVGGSTTNQIGDGYRSDLSPVTPHKGSPRPPGSPRKQASSRPVTRGMSGNMPPPQRSA
eukprot:TRINITY_DN31537_c0_g3_i1.p1 TRINITY_DN31537_c0_g3~~TRINITY_DN31537_c0_g3_i1.p1  ORF type:complete len:789 (-),score=253.72 TRINITY_DN31537_c0_g3_i1:328-2694(-)